MIAPRRRRRRARPHHAALLVAVACLVAMLGAQFWRTEHAVVPLYQVGVFPAPMDGLGTLSPGQWESVQGQLTGPSRVLPPAPDLSDEEQSLSWGLGAARAAQDRAWLASSQLPGAGTAYQDMARRALLDLHLLTTAGENAPGATLAGASRNWALVWPRDAAFVAVAFARAGHLPEALTVLGFVQAVQADDGSLHARYLPDGSGEVPDERGLQEDGPGWSLWAVRELVEAAPDQRTREAIGVSLGGLTARSAARLVDRIDPESGLPLPSPDYWEVSESELTLGIAATSAIGLEAAADLATRELIDSAEWEAAGVDPSLLPVRAERVRAQVVATFGPNYPRHDGGDPDAAVTFLLRPFTHCPAPGAGAARLAAVPEMRRPAGGVAPGAGWKRDGISWTPQTALQGLAAAGSGRRAEAHRWLDWLDAHRTEAGSLPEKVLSDGSPAAVAPLGWTSALVLITLDELEHDEPRRHPC